MARASAGGEAAGARPALPPDGRRAVRRVHARTAANTRARDFLSATCRAVQVLQSWASGSSPARQGRCASLRQSCGAAGGGPNSDTACAARANAWASSFR